MLYHIILCYIMLCYMILPSDGRTAKRPSRPSGSSCWTGPWARPARRSSWRSEQISKHNNTTTAATTTTTTTNKNHDDNDNDDDNDKDDDDDDDDDIISSWMSGDRSTSRLSDCGPAAPLR